MYRASNPITSNVMKTFETAFHFTINPPLRDFLLANNAGKPRDCRLNTSARERCLLAVLDFSPGGNAWEINRKMRKELGSKIIVIGIDRADNYLCVRRNLRRQDFVIWNHISNTQEDCTQDIATVLSQWKSGISNPAAGA